MMRITQAHRLEFSRKNVNGDNRYYMKPAIAVTAVTVPDVDFSLAAHVLPQMTQFATQRRVGQAVEQWIHHARHFSKHRREDVPLRITIGPYI